jgi:hypothetical protein
MNKLGVWVGLTFGHFSYQWMNGQDFGLAWDRSYVAASALAILALGEWLWPTSQ